MNPHRRSLIILLTCFIAGNATAQPRPAVMAVSANTVLPYHTNEHMLQDSRGDAYLFNSDTAMAIYCYQKAVDADSAKVDKCRSLDKLRRCYRKTAQSFYLKEY